MLIFRIPTLLQLLKFHPLLLQKKEFRWLLQLSYRQMSQIMRLRRLHNTFLDYPGQDGVGYCVFGKITEGTETIDKIKNVETGNHPSGHQDVPLSPVVIEEVTS